MDNQHPQSLRSCATENSDSLKPSERFRRLAKTVFGVKKQDVDAYAKVHPLEPQKPGRKPK